MRIERAFIIKQGSSGRSHVITSSDNEGWTTLPTLTGHDWNYAGGGFVSKVDWRCPSTWVNLIPDGKGCVGTYIKFDDGKEIVL